MLKIRLRRMGSRHRPFYRIVVSDSRRTPLAAALDEIGFYDPRPKPATLNVDVARVDHWVSQGAKPSKTVEKLIEKARLGDQLPAETPATPEEKAAKPAKAEKTPPAEKAAKPAKAEKADEPAKAEKADKPAKAEKADEPAKAEKADEPAKAEKADEPAKAEKTPPAEKADEAETEASSDAEAAQEKTAEKSS